MSNELRFKRLTAENWHEQDPTLSAFVRLSLRDGSTRTLSGDEWARDFLAVELSERVPLEVRRLFAVARGALVYGYFFYPLYTLGAEQLFRVAEAAVGHKCRTLGLTESKLKDMRFERRVAYLVDEGAIPVRSQQGWHSLRKLRNLTSHAEDQTILSPGMAIDELRRIAADIDALFNE